MRCWAKAEAFPLQPDPEAAVALAVAYLPAGLGPAVAGTGEAVT